jgi:hypothetical protein
LIDIVSADSRFAASSKLDDVRVDGNAITFGDRRYQAQGAGCNAFEICDWNNAADDRREGRRDFMRSFVEQYPEIRDHRHWDTIVRSGVASHHAGHMPAWKLVIEKMMSAGLLDAIFATATVAAAIAGAATAALVSARFRARPRV